MELEGRACSLIEVLSGHLTASMETAKELLRISGVPVEN
jgi:hypothetical protein